MAKQCHAIFFDVTFTSCDHNVFVVEQEKKHLLSRKQFKHSKLSQFTLLFFGGINLEICHALYM